MTINGLADLTGIRQSTLNNIVNRKSVPKVDTIYRISEALGVSVIEFLDIPPYNQHNNENEARQI